MADTLFGFTPQGAVSTPKTNVATAQMAATKAVREPFDFLGIAKGVHGVLAPIAEEKNAADAHQAFMESQQFITEIEQMDGANKVAAIENKIKEQAQGDYSQGYRNGSLAVLDRAYASALDQKEEERVVHSLNVVGSDFHTNFQAGHPEYQDPNTKVEEYAMKYNLNKGQVRDAIYFNTADAYKNKLANVTSYQQLNEVNAEWNAAKSKFGSTQFRTSKAKKFAAAVTASDQEIANVINLKKKEFKLAAKSKINTAIANEYMTPPEYLGEEFALAYDDDLAAGNAKRSYTEKYNDYSSTRAYMSQYSPDEAHPTPLDNPVFKEKWGDMVTGTALNHFVSGNANGFVDTILFNPDYSDKAGYALNQSFLQAKTSADLEPIVQQLYKISKHDMGATAIRRSIGDDEFVNILSTKYVADALYEGDVTKARTFVSQADENAVNLRADKKLYGNMLDYAEDLGPQYAAYSAVMNKLYAVNPKLANDEYKNVAKYFADQVDKKDGVTVDKALIHTYENKAYDPDMAHNSLISTFVEEVGSEPSKVTYLSDGTVFMYDNFSGLAKVYNVNSFIEDSNTQVKKDAEQRAYERELRSMTGSGKIENAIEDAPEIAITATAAIAEGLFNTAGQLIDRFTGYLGQQWDKDVDKLYSAIGLVSPTEKKALIDAMDMYSDKLPTELPSAAYKNLDQVERNTLRNTLMGNKKKQETAKAIKRDLLWDQNKEALASVIKAEGGYSTDPKDKGNYVTTEDYNNKQNFVGTKFGISASTLSNYLGRPATADDMKNLSQDTAEKILFDNYYVKYGVHKLPVHLQEIAYHAYVLSPANADKTLKANPTTTKEFANEYLRLLQDNASTWNIHGKGWSNRFNELGSK